jgi:uncharacterized Zn finger protein
MKRPSKGDGLKMSIRPEDMTDVCCDKCGNQTFVPVFLFKEVSAVIAPSGKKSLVPMQIFKCDECGHINDAFIPKPKKADDNSGDMKLV